MAKFLTLLILSIMGTVSAQLHEITHKVFFDIEIGEKPVGRLVLGLFVKISAKYNWDVLKVLVEKLSYL